MQVRRRDHLAPAVGQRAVQQHVGLVDVAADGEDLVAAQAGQRPVGGPVEHRVQRAR